MRPIPQQATEDIWRVRVREWRESGQTAADFARSRGFSMASLRTWSSRLGPSLASEPASEPAPGFVRLVPREAPTAPIEASTVVVEVGSARIRVTPGFDAALLAGVVRALSEGAT